MNGFQKIFHCERCGATVVQGPRGRSRGCEHFPTGRWGWRETIPGIKAERQRETTQEAVARGATRRAVEEIEEARREAAKQGEVWDEE
jgi:hypothetical protein